MVARIAPEDLVSPEVRAIAATMAFACRPLLEAEGLHIGVVENLQGISWRKVTIGGTANHAGTTPMAMRRDAGVAAARVIAFLDQMARATEGAVAIGSSNAKSPPQRAGRR